MFKFPLVHNFILFLKKAGRVYAIEIFLDTGYHYHKKFYHY
jgi:hypothetical protein